MLRMQADDIWIIFKGALGRYKGFDSGEIETFSPKEIRYQCDGLILRWKVGEKY